MNILFMSESFLNGGLESYIYTFYQELNKTNNVYFCFGYYKSDFDINKDLIFDGFNFSINSTIQQFCMDVDRLVAIINEKAINLILLNPFYSFFPAIFAAHITNTKIAYIYHGMASLNYPSNIIDTILFRYAFETSIKKAFCVTYQGKTAFKTINYDDAIYLPNPIDEKKYSKTKINFNKTWALISRLDNDKVNDILQFLTLLPDLDINKIDIYGEGSESNNIKIFVKNNQLEDKVEFKGYSNKIYKDIINKYTGIIGLGRVAMEGLTMNFPVLLIGFNKIVGIIDKELYKSISKYNFVPNYCNSLTTYEIQKQITEINKGKVSKYQLRKLAVNDFGLKRFINKFYKEISPISFVSRQNMVILYSEMIKLNVDSKNDLFYYSQYIYDLMYKYIASYTNDFNIKSYFNIYNNTTLSSKINK